jgi:hypothetical protein
VRDGGSRDSVQHKATPALKSADSREAAVKIRFETTIEDLIAFNRFP